MRKKICIALICSMFFVSSTLDAFAATNTPALDNADILDGGISNSEHEKEFDNTIKYIYALRKKGLSFKEIDKLLECENDSKSKITFKVTSKSPSALFYNYTTLNTSEKKLFKKNKAKGLLCLANGKLALNYSQDLYEKSVLHNGNGDAFRHTLWNYGMAIDVGQSFAKKWADAHENGAKGQPKLEKKMDLYNNKIGRGLAKTYPHTINHSTFKKNSRAKVRAGKCRIIKDKKLVKSSKKGENK